MPGTHCSKTSGCSSMTERPYVILYGREGREQPKLLRLDVLGSSARVWASLPINVQCDYEIRRHRSGDYFVQSSFLGFSEWCEDLGMQQQEEEQLPPLAMPPSERIEEPFEDVRRSLHGTLSQEVVPGGADAQLHASTCVCMLLKHPALNHESAQDSQDVRDEHGDTLQHLRVLICLLAVT